MVKPDLPTGTVTFLFTDIEGSTKQLVQHPRAYAAALMRHDAILRAAVEAHDGVVFETVGDAFYASFARPSSAVAAAAQLQLDLHAEEWGELGEIRVRAALHTGEVQVRGEHYFGAALYRCARLMAIGHGGQTLLSGLTARLVSEALPSTLRLTDLGNHRLKDLADPESVFQLEYAELASAFPPLRSLERVPNNLPAQLTSFIGRDRELEEVKALLGSTRLLTLTGLGGTGKTRLALQAAAETLEDYSDGIFFVDLAPLMSPDLVVSSIARTIGVRESSGESLLDLLVDTLRHSQVLLILDNFEHVLAAAPAVAKLQRACPHLGVLVTSRTRLPLSGEHEFVVRPLPVPDQNIGSLLDLLAEYPAVRLFVERASAVGVLFALTDQSANAIAGICRTLDGLPLALELAAARTKLLSPQALLARLSARFNLLTGGPQDAPARHQTLRGTVDWTYDFLSQTNQSLFRRLSVFVGGCTLESATATLGDTVEVLDGLQALVDEGFLRQTVDSAQPRFRMLETIREYANEKLVAMGELEAARRAHADYFLAVVEEAEPQLTGMDQSEWIERLDSEIDNLRATLRWSVKTGETECGLRLSAALWRFWEMRGFLAEGEQWLEDLLERDQKTSPAATAKALTAAGSLARLRGDRDRAELLHTQSLQLFRELGNKRGIARSISNLGVVANDRGDNNTAAARYKESLALRRELGDSWAIAVVLNNLGRVAREQGDLEMASSMFQESRGIFEELGDRVGIGHAIENLGEVADQTGDHAEARALYDASLGLRRELGDKPGMVASLYELGKVAFQQGDYQDAMGFFGESLTIAWELGAKQQVISCLDRLADVALAWGRPERAAELLGMAEGAREALRIHLRQRF